MAFSTNLRGLRSLAMAVIIRNTYSIADQAAVAAQANQNLSDKSAEAAPEDAYFSHPHSGLAMKRLKLV